MIIFKWSKSLLAALPSIPIASYCSIRRLAIGNLSSLNIDHLFNANGVTCLAMSTSIDVIQGRMDLQALIINMPMYFTQVRL
ncbi:MAG: hypothetical protein HRT38_11840 [Alteromonadaceae bacterium]|nr:hypothetical protein [Alteromonadaceae bacterium]